MATYKIISLRAQSNGFKQKDVKSAGTFETYEKACEIADKMNNSNDRIYTTYSAIKSYT